MGGNALSDCIVFGAISGRQAVKYAQSNKEKVKGDELFKAKEILLDGIMREKKNPLSPKEIKRAIKTIMWNSAGPVRWEEGLKSGLHEIETLEKEDLPRLQASTHPLELKEAIEAYHMAFVGEMIIRSALFRKESRGGGHFRLDYKEEDNKNWLKNIVIRSKKGRMGLETVPVEKTRFSPSQTSGGSQDAGYRDR